MWVGFGLTGMDLVDTIRELKRLKIPKLVGGGGEGDL
jgi:hypothetical protein